MTTTDQDRDDFEAWFEDTAGFTAEGAAIAWSSWRAALAHERARAASAPQVEPMAWVNESHRDQIIDRSGSVYWHAPMMCGKKFEGSFPVYLAASAPQVLRGIDKRQACRAAEIANARFGQWMPQRWLDLFIEAYGSAAPVASHEPASVSNKQGCVSSVGGSRGETDLLPIFADGGIGARLSSAMEAYRADYVFGLEDGPDHEPSEFERAMLEDFLNGAISDAAVNDILQEAARALTRAPPPEPSKPVWRGWYCHHCQRGVDGSEVTFHEQHEVCGTYIGDAEPPPPEPAKAEVVAWQHRYRDRDGTIWSEWHDGRYVSYAMDVDQLVVEERPLYATPPTAPAAAEVAETLSPSWFAAEVDRASEARARYEATLPSSAAPAAVRSAAWKPTHRHVKSGRLERVIGEAEAQVSTGLHIVDIDAHGVCEAWSRQVADGDRLTVYEGADGKLWVRFSDEFNDGRFVALPGEEA
ncbi:hypothetical protein V5F41_08230 [Xanthobacter autotrophicus]|uniref:hypothetical protein n=1 Tax=Xanthobacter autotrophicus TaxID=280 RepID=UPI003729D61B